MAADDLSHTPSRVPPAPGFGEPCPPRPSPYTLALLASRRSASAQALAAPGPSADELQDLIRLAARVPDHGKMTPWRFVVLQGAAKVELGERLRDLAARQPNPAKAQAALAKFTAPPLGVLVISSPREGGKPVWEQQLSAGAVCMTLVIAATAMGYGANWITDWYSYDEQAAALLGARPGEQIAGAIFIGTPTEPPLERVRPDLAALVQDWTS